MLLFSPLLLGVRALRERLPDHTGRFHLNWPKIKVAKIFSKGGKFEKFKDKKLSSWMFRFFMRTFSIITTKPYPR